VGEQADFDSLESRLPLRLFPRVILAVPWWGFWLWTPAHLEHDSLTGHFQDSQNRSKVAGLKQRARSNKSGRFLGGREIVNFRRPLFPQ